MSIKLFGEIRFTFFKNHLQTPNAPAFLPRAIHRRTRTIDDVIDAIAQDGTTITREEARAVFERYMDVLQRMLADGDIVEMPFAKFFPAVYGRIDVAGIFDQLYADVSIRKGSALKNLLAGVTLVPVDLSVDLVTIFSFINLRDQSQTTLMAGDLCTISGQNLSYDQTVETDGIFFVSAARDIELRVSEIIKTKKGNIHSRSISFKAPAGLTAGDWTLEIRKDTITKVPLIGYLDDNLTVV